MLFVECAIRSYLWSTSFLKISHVVQTTASRLTRIQTISEKIKSTKQHKCVDKVKPGTYCEHIWYSVECSKKLHMYLPMYATLNSITAIRGGLRVTMLFGRRKKKILPKDIRYNIPN